MIFFTLFLWDCDWDICPVFEIKLCHVKMHSTLHIVSWEPEGRYQYSEMFQWEPEGRYCCTIAIVPFWFSMEHLWVVIVPFWLSTDDIMKLGHESKWVQFQTIQSNSLNFIDLVHASLHIWRNVVWNWLQTKCVANFQVGPICLKCDKTEWESWKLKSLTLVDHWQSWMKHDEIHWGAVVAHWIRPGTLNREVPGSNLLAAAVVMVGKALCPHCLVSWKGLKAFGPLVAGL